METDGYDPSRVFFLAVPAGDIDGRFGGSVEVGEPGFGEDVEESFGQVVGESFAATDDLPEGGAQCCRFCLDERFEHGGHEVAAGDLLFLDDLCELLGITVCVGWCDTESGTDQKWPEELPDGDVEGVGGFLEYQVVLGQLVFILHPLESVDDSGVSIWTPLGLRWTRRCR